MDSGDILTLNEETETFNFQHKIVHTVVYNLLLVSQRIDLHTRVAVSLEASLRCGDMFKWSAIAHHWSVVARWGSLLPAANFLQFERSL